VSIIQALERTHNGADENESLGPNTGRNTGSGTIRRPTSAQTVVEG